MEISQKQLNKLKTVVKVVESGDFAVVEKIMEFEDFVDSLFEKYSSNISKIDEAVSNIDGLRKELERYIENNYGSKIDDLSKQQKRLGENLSADINDVENNVKENVKKYDNLFKSLDSSLNTVNTELKLIKSNYSSTKDLNVIKQEIRTINNLITADRIKEIIKPLLEDLKEFVKDKVKQDTILRPLVAIGGRQLRMDSFSFPGNDSDTVFYLPKVPGAKGYAIWAYYQGQHLQLGTHFTVANRAFTCVGFTPQTGSYIEGFIIL